MTARAAAITRPLPSPARDSQRHFSSDALDGWLKTAADLGFVDPAAQLALYFVKRPHADDAAAVTAHRPQIDGHA